MASAELTAIVNMLNRGSTSVSPALPSYGHSEALGAMFPVTSDVSVNVVNADGVPAEWVVAPHASTDRSILYFHGGGYVIGSVATHRGLAARLSRAASARVLLIDYRLAPEHPHPAAVVDATTAYRWLLAAGAMPSRTVIAGDSAGGGLAVATLVALRDARQPLPAAAVCMSPWIDLEALGGSMTSKAPVDPIVQRDRLLRMDALYLHGANPRTPLAAPLHARLGGTSAAARGGGGCRNAPRRRQATGAAGAGGRRRRNLGRVERHDSRMAALRAAAARGPRSHRAHRGLRPQAHGVIRRTLQNARE